MNETVNSESIPTASRKKHFDLEDKHLGSINYSYEVYTALVKNFLHLHSESND